MPQSRTVCVMGEPLRRRVEPRRLKYVDLGRGGDARMHLSHLYAVMGKLPEARKLLHEMESPARGDFVSPYDIASVYAGSAKRSRHWLGWSEPTRPERS